MATFTFDEREIEQLYLGCKSHEKDLLKLQKEANAARLSAPAMSEIAEQLRTNFDLRQQLNPRAEEEARAPARRKRGERVADPRQLDLEQEIKVSAEPNGKKKRKRISTAKVVEGLDVANPEAIQEPDDEFLVAQLKRAGVDVPQGIVDLWTSSERDSALTWAQAAIAEPKLGTPEMPKHVWKAVWSGRYDYDPRAATPTAAGVEDNQVLFNGWKEYWLELGPYELVELPAKRRGGPGKWQVRDGDALTARCAVYSGVDHGKAQRITVERNRAAAVSALLNEVRERRIAGDGWTGARPPKVSDVGAEQVHNAATEAR